MGRLTVMSGGFLFAFAQNIEEMDGLGPDSLIFSAKGVRISLGIRFQIVYPISVGD
jgi:hypothetical protein